ncbi:hypothetical protein Lser_V15G25816 [Lactuca serriola]
MVNSFSCMDEAWGIGKLRHNRVANLIRYCCDGDERILVAEYMPNNTIANHVFHCMLPSNHNQDVIKHVVGGGIDIVIFTLMVLNVWQVIICVRRENQTIKWAMYLWVALCIDEALDYCSSEGRPLYHELNAYRVIFHEQNDDPRIMCFGLMKHSRHRKSYSTNLAL